MSGGVVNHDGKGRAADHADVAIVGAGAAGLMAAIFAGRARGEQRVVALDGSRKIGSKILIAGGGRCNVTHYDVTPGDFNGDQNLIRRVLKSFDVPATRRFFEEDLGVRLKREETGKLFPVSDRAITVLDALLSEVEVSGVDLRRSARVESVTRHASDGFQLRTSAGELTAARVIIATGGRSVPKTGSDGAGYEMVRSLGHSVERTFPALVPLIVSKGHWMTELKGISHDVELILRGSSGRVERRIGGSILFTHFGLSGPSALDMSRHWLALKRDGEVTLEMSSFPGESFESLTEKLVAAAASNPRMTVSGWLGQRLPSRLADALIVEASETDPGVVLGELTRNERRSLVHALTGVKLPVVDTRGFDYAEVTAGGVPLGEVDTATMESRVCRGLYLCGEILDVDGRIGGFNFQWAWASGRLAGLSAATRG